MRDGLDIRGGRFPLNPCMEQEEGDAEVVMVVVVGEGRVVEVEVEVVVAAHAMDKAELGSRRDAAGAVEEVEGLRRSYPSVDAFSRPDLVRKPFF